MITLIADAAAPAGTSGGGDSPSVWTLAQMAFNVLVGLGMLWIGNKTKRIETLEQEIKQQTKLLVDAQIAAIKELMKVQIDGVRKLFDDALVAINERLKVGEGEFRVLGNRDQTIELKLAACTNEIKDYIRGNCANKADVHELGKELNALKVAVAAKARG